MNKKNDPFTELVKAIIYQQLSGKAASTIYNRFLGLYSEKRKHPSTKELINTDHEKLRNVGLSNQKVEYIKTIAEFFEVHPYSKKDFNKLTDNEIRDQIIGIRGVGPWTVDMFLMFTLNRLDVFPVLDLGVQKGFSKMNKLKKLPSEKKMIKAAEQWKPYRSIASYYFWKIAGEE